MTNLYEQSKAQVKAIAEMSDAELKATLIGRKIKTTFNGKMVGGTIVDVALNDRKSPYIASKYAVTFEDGSGGWVFANKVTIVG